MQLRSVNVGQQRTQWNGAALETTGIFKTHAGGPVHLGQLGLEGDFIGDAKNHGGPDQAVYVYGMKDYAWWSLQLGQEVKPGTFGENLAVSDLESAPLRIGDQLRIGLAILEVTAPRFPCSTLAARMRDPEFAEKFRVAERPGVYCRVLRTGTIRAEDPVEFVPSIRGGISVLEMFREHYRRDKTEVELRRILQAPISIRARVSLEKSLSKLLAARVE